MGWKETFTEDLRLVILRALDEFGGEAKCMTSSLLCKAIAELRHTATREQVLEQLPWLAEVGVISLEQVENTSMRAVTLLDMGERHIARKARVRGIAVPSRLLD